MLLFSNGPPFFRASLLLLFLIVLAPGVLFAQFGDYGQDQVEFGIFGCDTIPETKISAAYRFDLQYPNATVVYTVAEFKRNGDRVFLPGWTEGEMWDSWTAAQVGDTSKTASFVLAAGDELSFYRELGWYDPESASPEQTDTNFQSLDTLDFIVELVNAANGQRLALLDSMGILRRDIPGVPTYYGQRPIMALVEYEVPPTMVGITAFMRARLYSRGDGEYEPLRTDDIEFGISDRLTHPGWAAYIAAYTGLPGGSMPKLNVSDQGKGQQGRLSVVPNPVKDRATIKFRSGSTEVTNVVVYNALGESVFVNMNYPEGGRQGGRGEEKTILCEFPGAGRYFVALYEGENLVSVVPVVVDGK